MQKVARRPPFQSRFFRRPKELVGWILKRPSKRRVKVATSLRFLHEVLGLDRLHYGLWEEGDERSLGGLRAAQERYSRRLHDWIPEGVRTILDVGAGVGADALDLGRLGYEVDGLSPDPFQRERFVERTGRPYHLARFQDFAADHTYDLILMSESAQYIWLESLFPKARELAPGGWLLIADYFLKERTGERRLKSTHALPNTLDAAAAAGFTLERQEDVTDQVLPTLELARGWMERYAEPTLEIVSSSFQTRRPWLHRLLWPPIDRALHRSLLERGELDPAEFARTKCYMMLLFRADSSDE